MTADSLAIWLTLLLLMPSAMHDRDALQAQQRLVRNQGAVKVLIGRLAAFVGVLPDRYLQFARHHGAKKREPHLNRAGLPC